MYCEKITCIRIYLLITCFCFHLSWRLKPIVAVILQVPISSPADIFKQSFWLSICSDNFEVVHRFTSWFIPHNDIHVPESYWRFGWQSALCWAENSAGILYVLLTYFKLRNILEANNLWTIPYLPLPFLLDCAIVAGSYCRAMDAASKAISSEETTWSCMLDIFFNFCCNTFISFISVIPK